jgi:hypothetical protein
MIFVNFLIFVNNVVMSLKSLVSLMSLTKTKILKSEDYNTKNCLHVFVRSIFKSIRHKIKRLLYEKISSDTPKQPLNFFTTNN